MRFLGAVREIMAAAANDPGLRAACSLLPPAACLQARLVGRRCACRSRSPARSPRSPWLLGRTPSAALVPEHLLLRCRDIPDLRHLDVYLAHGGYQATRKALTTCKPEDLVEMVKASNLRGRGGAGAYICGEETGLIESLEGKRAYPRIKPPFPATHGLFGCPTIVNNVETLACVPHIVMRGADWFRSIGPEKSPGPKLFCVSGHVVRPGTYELPMGTPLRAIIYTHAGGIPNGAS